MGKKYPFLPLLICELACFPEQIQNEQSKARTKYRLTRADTKAISTAAIRDSQRSKPLQNAMSQLCKIKHLFSISKFVLGDISVDCSLAHPQSNREFQVLTPD